MVRLQRWSQNHKPTGALARTNVVIVPGHDGDTLADQTCSHFPKWLNDLVASRQNVTVWLFHHGLQVNNVAGWYKYCEAGEELLQHLAGMQGDDSLSEDDSLILIGHKLGCFILKKALKQARQISHKPNVDALVSAIDILVMVGEPHLTQQNTADWLPLILKCLPCKTLPQHLSRAEDATCLERVAYNFEEFTLNSSLFSVSSSTGNKKKLTLWLKHQVEDPRCICSADMSVRMWTTSATEITIAPQEGDQKNCAFHTGSTHFQNLISMPDYVPDKYRLPISSSQTTSPVQSMPESRAGSGPSIGRRLDLDSRESLASGRGEAVPIERTGSIIKIAAPMTSFTSAQRSRLEANIGSGNEDNVPFSQQANQALSLIAKQGDTTTDLFSSGTPKQSDSPTDSSGLSILECKDSIANTGTLSALAASASSADVSALTDDAVVAHTNPASFESVSERENVEKATDVLEAAASPEYQSSQHNRKYDVPYGSAHHPPGRLLYDHQLSPGFRRPFFFMRVLKRDAQFFGREELLTRMMELITPSLNLLKASTAHLSKLNPGTILILYGVPGVGKSAVALEAMYRIQQQYEFVFWLRATDEFQLARSFHEVAIGLHIVEGREDYDHESSRQGVLEWLFTTTANWLLIIDDADDLELLQQYIPTPCRGSIIVTTRNLRSDLFSIDKFPGLHTMQVPSFDLDEAAAFLRSLAPQTVNAADGEAQFAASMVLGRQQAYLPLILRMLGTMLRCRSLPQDTNIVTLLDRHVGGELFSQPSGPLIYGYLSPSSDALASVLSCFDPYRVDDTILLGAQRCRALALPCLPMTDRDYYHAKTELASHALLQSSAESITIHRVTQGSLRNNLKRSQLWRSLHSASQLLEIQWPSRRKLKNVVLGNWPEFDSLFSHVRELAIVYASAIEVLGDTPYENKDVLNDTLLNVLLLSTWYNARRGNANEDKGLVRLAFGLIAISSKRKSILRPNGTAQHATPLMLRLIDLGLKSSDLPRLVPLTSQTENYVAISHLWSAPLGTLTKENLESFEMNIDTSETCILQHAIMVTRMLGVRYMWFDALCILHDDKQEKVEALLNMSDIFSSAVATICDTTPKVNEATLNTSSEHKIVSLFLNRGHPEYTSLLKRCHQTTDLLLGQPCIARDKDLATKDTKLSKNLPAQGDSEAGLSATMEWLILATTFIGTGPSTGVWESSLPKRAAHHDPSQLNGRYLESQVVVKVSEHVQDDLKMSQNSSIGCLTSSTDKGTQSKTEVHDETSSKATDRIREGFRYIENNSAFKALASLMTAKELAISLESSQSTSEKIRLAASAGISIIYLLQKLPATGLDIAQIALAFQNGLPKSEPKLAFELCRLHFVIGSLHSALGNAIESLESYEMASKYLGNVPDEQQNVADWRNMINLKLGEHFIQSKDYKHARDLLQKTLDHFQSLETIPAQAHLARTLHQQAKLFEAEGKKTMARAIQAAARETWIAVREARGHSVPADASPLTAAEFDAEVEFWFRS